MKEDEEGFAYPVVDGDSCINCHLCEKVCPVLHGFEGQHIPGDVYACKNPDESVRLTSSSGGVFTMLAEKTIEKGGVVFGVRWNKNWEAEFDYAEGAYGLEKFRGSKYLQAKVNDAYVKVQAFLKEGREVLFSGTSCQVAALKLFLRKEYEKLITVDVVCHGVPSPGLFRKYVSDLAQEAAQRAAKNTVLLSPSNHLIPETIVLPNGMEVLDIRFRDKMTGWKKFSFALVLAKASGVGKKNSVSLSYTHSEDRYMQAFLRNLSLRPSCYKCPAKAGKCHSDLTIADYWGIEKEHPDFFDDKGVGLVIVNSERGKRAFSEIPAVVERSSYEAALRHNLSIERSVPEPRFRPYFWKHFKKRGWCVLDDISRKQYPSFFRRVLTKLSLIREKYIHR